MKYPAVQPYLSLAGRSEEALNYYTKVFKTKIELLIRFEDRINEFPKDSLPKGYEQKIMHGEFKIGEHYIMLSDGCGEDSINFDGFCLSVTLESEEEVRRIHKELCQDGEEGAPLHKTFWTDLFGIAKDKFGVSWIISLPPITPNA